MAVLGWQTRGQSAWIPPQAGAAITPEGPNESPPMNKFITLGAVALCSVAAIGCESEPEVFDRISAKVYCESRIKQLLRDPDSYQFESATVHSTDGEFGTATVYFRSRNGFGGYSSGSASCEMYPKEGQRWVRAQLN